MEQEIREALSKATKGPWYAQDSNDVWQLFGGHMGVMQLIKAPKHGTDYAEYWPDPADAHLIANAPTYLEWCLSQIADQQVMKETSEGNIVTLLHEKEAMWNEVLGLRMQIAELQIEIAELEEEIRWRS